MSEFSGYSFTPPPEYYADTVKMALSPYGIRFDFGLQSDSPGESTTNAIVRMSPQHAFVLCQLLRKNLKVYEDQIGKINLPAQLLADLGIDGDLP